MDPLIGLKENVILGHLIPAGTGFKSHLELQVEHLAEPVEKRELAPTEAHAMMQEAHEAVAEMASEMTPATEASGEGGGEDQAEGDPLAIVQQQREQE